MVEQALFAVSYLIVPACAGVFFALRVRNRRAPAIAAAVAWLGYLVFNLYADGHSRDSELTRGTWPYFQLTGGTFVALLAAACSAGTLRALAKMKN
jgi:H+/Cl- antiporter ClcA